MPFGSIIDLEAYPSTILSPHTPTLSPQLTSILAKAAVAQAGSNPNNSSLNCGSSNFLNGSKTAFLNVGSPILNGGSQGINGGNSIIGKGEMSTHIKGGISFNIPQSLSGGNMNLSNGNIPTYDKLGETSFSFSDVIN